MNYILALPPRSYEDQMTKSQGIADAGLSMQNQLISDEDKAYLEHIEDTEFFCIQAILCKVIPYINTNPSVLMNLVGFLVKRGRNDLAANQPNAAFRKWCEVDLSRADEVINLAQNGDAIARKHLVFALQAKGEVRDAITCLEHSPQEQIAGAVALGSMRLDRTQSLIALEKTVSLAMVADPKDAYQFASAAYDIAATHSCIDRRQLQKLLCKLFLSHDPWVIHLAASLLNHHHLKMTETEFDLCQKKVLDVDPDHLGTIKEIDQAIIGFLENENIQVASRTACMLIQNSDGIIDAKALDSFFHNLGGRQSKLLAQVAADWLQHGGPSPCFALMRSISELNKTEPAISMNDIPLPPSANEQIFLCRKTIGYLFPHSMSAAAFAVAVLDRGHPNAKKGAMELLFNPLLLNYRGSLVKWLETVSKSNENCRPYIDEILKRAKDVSHGIKRALDVVELMPSKSERDVVAFQEMEETEHIRGEANKRSILADVIKNEHLLYGDQTAFSIMGDSGEVEHRTIPFSEIEIRSELPVGIFLDPVGLEMMLEGFRYEGLKGK